MGLQVPQCPLPQLVGSLSPDLLGVAQSLPEATLSVAANQGLESSLLMFAGQQRIDQGDINAQAIGYPGGTNTVGVEFGNQFDLSCNRQGAVTAVAIGRAGRSGVGSHASPYNRAEQGCKVRGDQNCTALVWQAVSPGRKEPIHRQDVRH